MDNLVQKLNWDMPFIKNQCIFVYADVDFEMEDGYIEQRHVSINQLQKRPSDEEIGERIARYNSGIKEVI